MNFQTMEYFRAIAEQRSFTKAAEQLHVTQQTLSAHIAGVERELGTKLIVRSTPLRLTHEGETFLSYAKRFGRGLADLRREIAGPSQLQSGTLRVGISFTRGRTILPGAIERFCELYPNVTVDLREDTNETLATNLMARRLDVAIGVFSGNEPLIEAHPFFDERMVLLATRELFERNGLSVDDLAAPLMAGDVSPLAGCPFVLSPPEDISGQQGLKIIERAGFRPHVKAFSRNMATLLSLALRSVGVCICPLDLLNDTGTPEQKRNLISYELGADASYAISYALPAGGYRWPVVDEFVRIATEHVASVEAITYG